MENKYYTPEIEEFCVGLECEWKQDLQDFTVDEWVQNWSKHTITRDDFIDRGLANEFTSIYRLNKWRVKYLDEQDIFDCGFEYTNNKRDLIKDNVRVRTYIGEHFEIPNIAIYKDKIRVFRGKIKNKTDFKKLLSQLGI